MTKRRLAAGFLLAAGLLVLSAAVANARPSHVSGLPNTCSKPFGKGDYVIASDLPLQGALRPLSVQITQAIQLELKSMNYQIGGKTVQYVSCDDSTAAKGSWDPQTCTNNANAYKSVTNLLGVIGTFNSGCAEIEAPILNRAPGGGIAMVSPANTYVGLTKPTGVAGEPQKYFPTGKRNYARVAVPDNFQGAADAQFLKGKGVTSVYVLNDGEAYGVGIANNFANAAKALGITVLGNDKWDASQPNYQSLFQGIASKNPGAVFLGGIVSNNGGQLIKDKVSVLGDNSKVILMGPDGFNDSATAKDAGTAAEGMYVTIGGQDPNKLTNATGQAFVDGLQEGLPRQAARGLHGIRRRRRSWCSRTPSRRATARARASRRSCTARTSRTASSARSGSTRPATRPSAASRSTRSRTARSRLSWSFCRRPRWR